MSDTRTLTLTQALLIVRYPGRYDDAELLAAAQFLDRKAQKDGVDDDRIQVLHQELEDRKVNR